MPDLAPGSVTIESRPDGWFLIQIGRARKTKQFYLSHAEASELAAQLASLVKEGRTAP